MKQNVAALLPWHLFDKPANWTSATGVALNVRAFRL